MEIMLGLALVVIVVGMTFGPQIGIWLMLHEIRKIAATLPEKDREAWINASIKSINDAL